MKGRPFLQRFGFALAGLREAWRTERSLRVEAAVMLAGVIALLIIEVGAVWWALYALASAGVLAGELLNSALERLADHLHPEQHTEIGAVKDIGAAAVLVLCLGALAVAALAV